MLGIDAHNDQGCTGIELSLLYSARGLEQKTLTTHQRRHFSSQNNEQDLTDDPTDDLTVLTLVRKS